MKKKKFSMLFILTLLTVSTESYARSYRYYEPSPIDIPLIMLIGLVILCCIIDAL